MRRLLKRLGASICRAADEARLRIDVWLVERRLRGSQKPWSLQRIVYATGLGQQRAHDAVVESHRRGHLKIGYSGPTGEWLWRWRSR